MNEFNFLSRLRIAVVGLELMGCSLAFELSDRCLDAREIPVPGGLAHCIRVHLQSNKDIQRNAIHNVYLGAAVSLRPDLSSAEISI